MSMVNRENCLNCPARPEESACRAWLAKKVLRENYRPSDCGPGPQKSVEHTDEAVSAVIGPVGLGYGRMEMACGKNGEITEVEFRSYANGVLYSVRRGGETLFFDADKAPKPPLVAPTQEEIDLEMACWDTY